MNMDAVSSYIERTFQSTQIDKDSENKFFSYHPDPNITLSGWTPYATLIANDAYDQFSRLNRDGVFRLNIGVKPETYRELFGQQPTPQALDGLAASYDFSALDQIMPHPLYASASWICVLNPSKTTFQAIKPLLEEGYEMAVRRYETKVKRRPTGD